MKLFQYDVAGEQVVVAAANGRRAIVPGVTTTAEILTRAGTSARALVAFVNRQLEKYGWARPPVGARGPLRPVAPAEIWGFGVTYKASAASRDKDARADFYKRAHKGPRPETFFKATASRCVGPGEDIGIRGDSEFTAPEAELAYVVGLDNRIVAFTLANDVSAWDIERENPLYLPQSKIYNASCSLGPCLVTADEINPRDITLTLTIRRRRKVIFRGRATTKSIRFSLPYLHRWLTRYNNLPVGAVVMTGTGITVPPEAALRDGDEVVVAARPFGALVNLARLLKPAVRGSRGRG